MRYLFLQQHTRTTHFLRNIFLLRQAVLHRQDRFLIIDMEGGLERHGRDYGGIDIGQLPEAMIREEMPAAGLAPLSQTPVSSMIDADIFFSLGDFQFIGRPQRERIDRSSRPFPARTTMAVANCRRFTSYRKLNGTTETLSLMVLFIAHMDLPIIAADNHMITGTKPRLHQTSIVHKTAVGPFEKPSSDRNLSVIKAKADALPYTVMKLVGPRKREVMSCWRRDRNAFH